MPNLWKYFLCICFMLLSSCIEQDATKPEGSIVVIGNGFGPSTWKKTIVAEVMALPKIDSLSNEPAPKLKSYILDEGKKVSISRELSWIVPAASGEEAVIKFKEPQVGCTVMKADLQKIECDPRLNSLVLSDKYPPMFLANGGILYADQMMTLHLSWENRHSVVGEGIVDFFVDKHGNIFWNKKMDGWHISSFGPNDSVSSSRWLPGTAIVYLSKSGEVMAFLDAAYEMVDPKKETVATDKPEVKILDAQTLYSYDSAIGIFRPLWKNKDGRLKLNFSHDRRDVYGQGIVLTGSLQKNRSSTPGVFVLSPSGVLQLPVAAKYLNDVTIDVGERNIFLTPQSDDPRLIGSLCSFHDRSDESEESISSAFECKILMVPEGSSVSKSALALAGDDLIVGVTRHDAKAADAHEVYGLESSVNSEKLGKIERVWKFENSVTGLRYFEAHQGLISNESSEIVTEDEGAAKMRQPDFGSSKEPANNRKLTDESVVQEPATH